MKQLELKQNSKYKPFVMVNKHISLVLFVALFTSFLIGNNAVALTVSPNVCCLYSPGEAGTCMISIGGSIKLDFDPFQCSVPQSLFPGESAVPMPYAGASLNFFQNFTNASCLSVDGYTAKMVKGYPNGDLSPSDKAICEKFRDLSGSTFMSAVNAAIEKSNQEGAGILAGAKALIEEIKKKQEKTCCVPNTPQLGFSCSPADFTPTIAKVVNYDENSVNLSDPLAKQNYINILSDLLVNLEKKSISDIFECGTSGFVFYPVSCQDSNPAQKPNDKYDTFYHSVADFCSFTEKYQCACKKNNTDSCVDTFKKDTDGCLAFLKENSYSESEWICKENIISGPNCPIYSKPATPENTGPGLSVAELKNQARSALNPMKFSGGQQGVLELIGRTVKALMYAMGSILFALYIYAGILWMTSSGNSERVGMAKKIVVWSTLGVIVQLSAYMIVNIVFKFVN